MIVSLADLATMATTARYLRLVTEEPVATCPKCSHPVDERACARCGLTAAHRDQYLTRQDTAAPGVLVEAWRETRRAWREPAAHDRMLYLASQHGNLPWLATRYREIARRHDAIATERLVRVKRAAELTLLVSSARQEDEAPKFYRSTRLLLGLMLLALAFGCVLMRVAAGAHAP
jgi:hypothetical protein